MSTNWVRMTATSRGTAIALQETLDGFVAVSSRYADNEKVYYILQEGDNKEVGVGTYRQSDNSILRAQILETLVNGVFTQLPTAPMPIASLAIFAVVPSAQGLTEHTPVWRQVNANLMFDPNTNHLSPDMKTFIERTGHEIRAWSFNSELKEGLYFTLDIPFDVEQGSGLVPYINWSPATSEEGNVNWIMEISVADSDAANNEYTDIVSLSFIVDTTGKALAKLLEKHLNTIPNIQVGMTIVGKIYRNGGDVQDTYADDAFIRSVGFMYKANKVGLPNNTPDYYRWQ